MTTDKPRKRDYKAEYQKRMERSAGTYNTNRRNPGKGTPTGETYNAFQNAFQVFNRELFANQLNPLMITLRTFGKARGYFSRGRFVNLEGLVTAHEIALDPRQFMDRTPVEILSTLAHEMAHAWQTQYGSPSRNGYHNAEWAAKMHEVGLHPSSTGQPGGKETGQKVSHYIVTGGRFEQVATKLVRSGAFTATWADVEGFLMVDPDKVPAAVAAAANAAGMTLGAPAKKGKSGSRVKYTCATCGANAWGKDGLRLGCGGTDAEPHDPSTML
jgi:predicted SprT family Zn-dependent metalloprotease